MLNQRQFYIRNSPWIPSGAGIEGGPFVVFVVVLPSARFLCKKDLSSSQRCSSSRCSRGPLCGLLGLCWATNFNHKMIASRLHAQAGIALQGGFRSGQTKGLTPSEFLGWCWLQKRACPTPRLRGSVTAMAERAAAKALASTEGVEDCCLRASIDFVRLLVCCCLTDRTEQCRPPCCLAFWGTAHGRDVPKKITVEAVLQVQAELMQRRGRSGLMQLIKKD